MHCNIRNETSSAQWGKFMLDQQQRTNYCKSSKIQMNLSKVCRRRTRYEHNSFVPWFAPNSFIKTLTCTFLSCGYKSFSACYKNKYYTCRNSKKNFSFLSLYINTSIECINTGFVLEFLHATSNAFYPHGFVAVIQVIPFFSIATFDTLPLGSF